MREFVARYEGYPVRLVGAAQLQGHHYPSEGEPIDTSGNPELEFALMADFIEERDVRWPVLIIPRGYLFEQIGQRGIPSGLIVDPKGIVRAETPSIRHRYHVLCEEVDRLLRQAGLPVPPPLP